MSAQISWDESGRHVAIVLDHPVPADDDVDGALCAYHGIERAYLHSDRAIVEMVVACPAQRVCAEAALLYLFVRGYLRPVMWFEASRMR